ncbi:MAG TPA: hypothetical protein VKU01_07525 [Bryobacteraceae bacterium]|nr:hypothetical protein [Bryobacteraceae bacterium]
MKVINAQLLASAATILALGLLCLDRPASAQSNCKDVKGNSMDVFNPVTGVFSGKISNAGDLDGTTAETFTGSAPTPAPTVFSFTADFVLTTHDGQLKASWVNLYDNATGLFTVMAVINPTTSTGRFAGATGVLYSNGKTVSSAPFTVAAELAGQICYAGNGEN